MQLPDVFNSRKVKELETIVKQSGVFSLSNILFPDDFKNLNLKGSLSLDRYHINTTIKEQQWNAYQNCAVVQTIIEKRQNYTAAGELCIMDERTDEEVKGQDAKDILRLLNNPNPLQNYKEFEASIIAYINTFGFCPLYKVYGANKTKGKGLPQAIWAVNPLHFIYTLKNKYYNQTKISEIIEKVQISDPNGTVITLQGEDQLSNVWIINGSNIQKDDLYTSQSPLYPLSDAINTFNIGLNIYGNLLERSILGIISNKSSDKISGTIPLRDEEIKEVQERVRSYGLTQFKYNYIISNKALFFQSMATNMGSLAIPDGVKLATETICDKMQFAPELLAEKDSTFENKKTALINQYQSDIIPNAEHIAHSLTQFLIPDSGLEIEKDFSELAIMQKDLNASANTFNTIVGASKTAVEAGFMTVQQGTELINTYLP